MRIGRAGDIRWEQKRRGSTPFAAGDGFNAFNWHTSSHTSGLLDGVEVARVKLNHDFRPVAYVDVPSGPFTLIEWLEIHAELRGQGIGREVLKSLQQQFPGRTLAAYPTETSRTWWSDKVQPAGWGRADHPDGPERGSPLYTASCLRHR